MFAERGPCWPRSWSGSATLDQVWADPDGCWAEFGRFRLSLARGRLIWPSLGRLRRTLHKFRTLSPTSSQVSWQRKALNATEPCAATLLHGASRAPGWRQHTFSEDGAISHRRLYTPTCAPFVLAHTCAQWTIYGNNSATLERHRADKHSPCARMTRDMLAHMRSRSHMAPSLGDIGPRLHSWMCGMRKSMSQWPRRPADGILAPEPR